MFPRSKNPLVSVLLPTRKRPKNLVASMDSLLSLAVENKFIEFILRIDNDDNETIDVANKLCRILPIKYIIAQRGSGYQELHNFYNDMARLATGDWLMIFNDDALMNTQGWDQILKNINPFNHRSFGGHKDICLVGVNDGINANGFKQNDYNWAFPFVRRKLVDILGHITFKSHVDFYLYELHRALDAAIVIKDIQIKEVSHTISDLTQKEGRLAYNTLSLQSFLNQPDVLLQREKDIEKIKKYISSN